MRLREPEKTGRIPICVRFLLCSHAKHHLTGYQNQPSNPP